MNEEQQAEERRRFEIIGGTIAVVVVVTIIGFFVAVIWRSSDSPAAPSSTETPSPTMQASEPGDLPPRLLGPADLRSSPAPNVAIVTRVAETEAFRVLGRSPDGEWLAISLVDRPGVTGWVRAAAVAEVEVSTLPVIEGLGATSTPPAGGGTLTPDLPDLTIDRVFASDNRLTVTLLNVGVADAVGIFRVSVNGDEPVELDIKPGEALRPTQRLEAPVPGYYVQIRSVVSILLLPEGDRPEEDEENNLWEGIVEPDQPVDIEISGASLRPGDGALMVHVRNNSGIPIGGTFTVSVREAPPSTTLLGRIVETMTIESDETVDFVFEALLDVDLTRVTISLSNNAIDDANVGNNSYPR